MNCQTERTRLNAELDYYQERMESAFDEVVKTFQTFQQAHHLSDADMVPLQRAVTDLFCRCTHAAGQAGVATADLSALDCIEAAQPVTGVMPS